METKLMKIIAVAVVALTMTVVAEMAPVEYNGSYYQVVVISDLTWDVADTLAKTLTYEGYVGSLVALETEAEYNFVRSSLGLGEWDIAWIGGRNVADTYKWVISEDAVDFGGWSASPWMAGKPGASDYGMVLYGWGSGYDSKIGAEVLTDAKGHMIIQYVPEPATMALLGLGGLFLRRRRQCN